MVIRGEVCFLVDVQYSWVVILGVMESLSEGGIVKLGVFIIALQQTCDW